MERTTTKCNKCNKEISKSNYKRHFNSCTNKKEIIYNIDENGNFICVCGKGFKSKLSLSAHKSHCGKNRNYPSAWNKGLDKTDHRIQQQSETYKKRIKDGLIIPSQLGNKHSDEYKKKLSDKIKSKVKDGTWHLSFAHSRIHEYKGVKLHGTWELEYAKFLDENNIKWRRPTERFEYTFKNTIRYYTPDFYLIDTKTYIEIKGYPTPKDFAKWNNFPVSLKIFSGANLKQLGIITEYKSLDVQYKNTNWL